MNFTMNFTMNVTTYPTRILLTTISALALSLFPTLSPTASAHEGHGHDAGAEAPHGGMVKDGKTMNLELVVKGNEIQLYPLKKDGTSISTNEIKATATAQPPKKTKEKIELKSNAEFYQGTYDAKGSYRYELKVEAQKADPKKGTVTETFTFQVETKG